MYSIILVERETGVVCTEEKQQAQGHQIDMLKARIQEKWFRTEIRRDKF